MRGAFETTEAEEAAPRHETELTLGSATLLLIFFGLVLLCGLCFGLGYSMGHRGLQYGSADAGPTTPAVLHGENSLPKPSAESEPPPAAAPPSTSPDTNPNTVPVAESSSGPAPSSASALPSRPISAPPASAPPSKGASPAENKSLAPKTPVPSKQEEQAAPAKAVPSPPAGPTMVQIASVSEDEDAEVLVGALRKRGYAVIASREPLDGLIHVRIGPFKTRGEADTWRQKLISDGYNAIVQP